MTRSNDDDTTKTINSVHQRYKILKQGMKACFTLSHASRNREATHGSPRDDTFQGSSSAGKRNTKPYENKDTKRNTYNHA